MLQLSQSISLVHSHKNNYGRCLYSKWNVNRVSWLYLAAATNCVETFHPRIFLTDVCHIILTITNIGCEICSTNFQTPCRIEKVYYILPTDNVPVVVKWSCWAKIKGEMSAWEPIGAARDVEAGGAASEERWADFDSQYLSLQKEGFSLILSGVQWSVTKILSDFLFSTTTRNVLTEIPSRQISV